MFLPVAVFLVIAGIFWGGLGRDPTLVPSVLIDQPAPAFSLPPLHESAASLSNADFEGQVTLVNIFASWCVPCRAEHPLWMKLAEEGSVRMVGINYKDQPAAAKQWLDELGDPYTLIGADRTGRFGIDWGVYGVPETFLVDREGRIRYKHVGPVSPALWEKELLPALQALGGLTQ